MTAFFISLALGIIVMFSVAEISTRTALPEFMQGVITLFSGFLTWGILYETIRDREPDW